ncbi:hypothetical protein POV27_07445 [Aureisphaera galaxeae]|uniref:hypothetical protein n=1 Tax=Aureisphaera galaxeae TaxID=1538023 RepID=UPI00235032F4|nr:hypothetical protein [Aureisphaera galaxeae]MDC8003881.1 hypothetical protein [Aureisphaera galaxeae]
MMQVKNIRSQTIIHILAVVILISCNGNRENRKAESPTETESKVQKVEIVSSKDYSENADKFVRTVLRENLRKHLFDLSQSGNPKHIDIFQSEGLERVHAYSNKNYPKSIEPDYYEHFTLFMATYRDSQSAREIFRRIASDSKFGLGEHRNLEEEQANRILSLNIGAKPGGMIIQRGVQVFSLVETCRDAPLNWTWEKYEDTFLEFLEIRNEEVDILNSYCGSDRYREEKRKPSQNSL